MASNSSRIPYTSQSVDEVKELVRKLEECAIDRNKKSVVCKKTVFKVKGLSEDFVINSWRFRDWDYKRPDLPTYARGLFIGGSESAEDEIMIRGYDKFFNTGEVSATKWPNIMTNTKGPYEISLKENGCIVFISGLRDGTLLVCSKHSTGPRDNEVSHAIAAEIRIDKQLASIGKTREQLARELRKKNVTAVAELCDDDFEEHILAYTGKDAGLYLHGMNLNIPRFSTYSGDLVKEFAENWGFKTTHFSVTGDIQMTRRFLEDVAETGSYNGRDVEGFVIRCKIRHDGSGSYEDWFFKYKFEEPYLMYRQWRECTKALINNQKPLPIKKHVAITKEYLQYAKRKIDENPSIGAAFGKNHGIIKLRNDFLREKNFKGSDIMSQDYVTNSRAQKDNRIILLPIGTICCGKTTIAVSLQKIFNWGLVQNDNITGKGRPSRFTKEVLELLREKPVVFADRNNAQRHERAQFINDVNSSDPAINIVALYFIHSIESLDKTRQVTRERVFSRGDNHQSIRASSERDKTLMIMEGFIKRFECLDTYSKPDNGFDAVIQIDPALDSRENLEVVISKLHKAFPRIVNCVPSSEVLDDAVSYAINDYKQGIRNLTGGHAGPNLKNPNQKMVQQKAASKVKPVEYFGIVLQRAQILQIVASTFESDTLGISDFWNQLKNTNRVQPEFHITLIHRASSKANPELWKKYNDMYNKERGDSQHSGQKIGNCRALLERIVWDDRLMAIVVRIIDEGWSSQNLTPHITVGTRDNDVKPKESNDLLQRWAEDSDSKIRSLSIEGRPVVDGTVTVILSRK